MAFVNCKIANVISIHGFCIGGMTEDSCCQLLIVVCSPIQMSFTSICLRLPIILDLINRIRPKLGIFRWYHPFICDQYLRVN